MKNSGLFSRFAAALTRLRDIVDGGPGNTAGEPMGVGGHLVFARPSAKAPHAADLPPAGSTDSDQPSKI